MTEDQSPTSPVKPFRLKRSKFAFDSRETNIVRYDRGVAISDQDKDTKVVVEAILEQSDTSGATGLVGYRVTRCPSHIWAFAFNGNPVSVKPDLLHSLAVYGMDVEIGARKFPERRRFREFKRSDYLIVKE